MSGRGLDHLVLPVAGLAATQQRLTKLGFTVAPQGVHPFGTINCCVYFADGTFIEPLAIGDEHAVEAAIAEGNGFVLGDHRFRAAHGDEGLAAIVLATDDAEADHERFSRLGISGGSMVEFSRPSLDSDGNADTASFLLAFAAPKESADAFFFTCERRKVARIDRSALERHANTATRIVAVEAEAAEPRGFADFLAVAAESAPIGRDDYVEVVLKNATIRIARNKDASGPRLTGIVFGVRDLGAVAALFNEGAIGYQREDKRLCVPASAGQGARFVFEEAP